MCNSSTSYFNEEIYKTENYYISDRERLEIKLKIQSLIKEKKRIQKTGYALKCKINKSIKNNKKTMNRTVNYMSLGGEGNKILKSICLEYHNNIDKPIQLINHKLKELKLCYTGDAPYFENKNSIDKDFFSFNIGCKFDFK